MDKAEKITFNTTLLLFLVIVLSTLIIFMLTPSPISAARRYFGYITGIYAKNSQIYLNFDRAEWLTDSESDFPATSACINDGQCPDCPSPPTRSCLSNRFYIKNADYNLKTYKVAGFTRVGTLLMNPEWSQTNPESRPYRDLSLSEFMEIFQNPASPDAHIRSVPYNITQIGGVVFIISQHYIP